MQSRIVQHTDTRVTQKLTESIFKKGLGASRFLRQVGVFSAQPDGVIINELPSPILQEKL